MLRNIDVRILLLVFFVILALYVLNPAANLIAEKTLEVPVIIDHSQEDSQTYQDQLNYDGNEKIQMDKYLYERFVDLLTKYSLKVKDQQTKALYVYFITFELFNRNFHRKRLEALNVIASEVKFAGCNNMEFPTWNKYHNLQKLFAAYVCKMIVKSDRELKSDYDSDKKVMNVYLDRLMNLLEIEFI